MKKYENIETGEIMTLDEVREHFYEVAKGNPDTYDYMNFNEFLNEALGKNGSLRDVTKRVLMFGYDSIHGSIGELDWCFCDTFNDAVNAAYAIDTHYVGTLGNICYYANDDKSKVYGMREIVDEPPYIVIRWSKTFTTDFKVFTFDVESDAYLFMINDAGCFLGEDYDAPRCVWFGNEHNTDVIKIDIGDDLYRWNFIHNYT